MKKSELVQLIKEVISALNESFQKDQWVKVESTGKVGQVVESDEQYTLVKFNNGKTGRVKTDMLVKFTTGRDEITEDINSSTFVDFHKNPVKIGDNVIVVGDYAQYGGSPRMYSGKVIDYSYSYSRGADNPGEKTINPYWIKVSVDGKGEDSFSNNQVLKQS